MTEGTVIIRPRRRVWRYWRVADGGPDGVVGSLGKNTAAAHPSNILVSRVSRIVGTRSQNVTTIAN